MPDGNRLRFFNEKGEPVDQEVESVVGETPGWNGSLEKPVFVQRRVTLTAPAGAQTMWLVMRHRAPGPPSAKAHGSVRQKGAAAILALLLVGRVPTNAQHSDTPKKKILFVVISHASTKSSPS